MVNSADTTSRITLDGAATLRSGNACDGSSELEQTGMQRIINHMMGGWTNVRRICEVGWLTKWGDRVKERDMGGTVTRACVGW